MIKNGKFIGSFFALGQRTVSSYTTCFYLFLSLKQENERKYLIYGLQFEKKNQSYYLPVLD